MRSSSVAPGCEIFVIVVSSAVAGCGETVPGGWTTEARPPRRQHRPMNNWCPSLLSVMYVQFVQHRQQRVATDWLRGAAQARKAYK